MNNQPNDDSEMPSEIDFGKGVRGRHHIPPGAKVMMPFDHQTKPRITASRRTDTRDR